MKNFDLCDDNSKSLLDSNRTKKRDCYTKRLWALKMHSWLHTHTHTHTLTRTHKNTHNHSPTTLIHTKPHLTHTLNTHTYISDIHTHTQTVTTAITTRYTHTHFFFCLSHTFTLQSETETTWTHLNPQKL